MKQAQKQGYAEGFVQEHDVKLHGDTLLVTIYSRPQANSGRGKCDTECRSQLASSLDNGALFDRYVPLANLQALSKDKSIRRNVADPGTPTGFGERFHVRPRGM